MRRLNVIIPPVVRRQIDAITDYIARDSIDNALAWQDRLLAAIEELGDFHGHAVDEVTSKRLGIVLRKTVFEGIYLIHYHVGEQVAVVNVRHGARLPRSGEP